MGIKERLFKKTPPFFRKLRSIGLAIIATGTTVSTVNVSMPSIVKEISGYLIVAGSVMVAVSQAVVKDEE